MAVHRRVKRRVRLFNQQGVQMILLTGVAGFSLYPAIRRSGELLVRRCSDLPCLPFARGAESGHA
jgi:hypothetical protein